MHGPSSVLDPTTQTQTLYIPFASPPTPSPSPAPSPSHRPTTTNRTTRLSHSAHSADPNDPSVPNVSGAHNEDDLEPTPARRAFLTAILTSCTPSELHFLSTALLPLLSSHPRVSLPPPPPKDNLTTLPPELGLHILGCVNDPQTLVRAGALCRVWRGLGADEGVWRGLCLIWGFMGDEADYGGDQFGDGERGREDVLWGDVPRKTGTAVGKHKYKEKAVDSPPFSYRAHFRRNYVILMNWRHGGRLLRSHELPTLSAAAAYVGPPLLPPPPLTGAQHHPSHYHQHQHHPPTATDPYSYNTGSTITTNTLTHTIHTTHTHTHNTHYTTTTPTPESQPPDNGVVTSLALDHDWVVVGLASSRIHVFSAKTGVLARTLVGHEAGVWGVCLVSAGEEGTGKEKERERFGDEEIGNVERRGDGKEGIRAKKGKEKEKKAGSSKGKSRDAKSKDKGKTRAGRNISGRARGDEDIEYQDHLIPPGLRAAMGLESDLDASRSASGSGSGSGSSSGEGSGSGSTSIREGRRKGSYRGVGGRGIVDEDAEESGRIRPSKDEHRHQHQHPHPNHADEELSESNITEPGIYPTYTPERMSDPAFASAGWGQPGALVVSGGCDKVVKVWDVRSGQCIYTLRGHTATIRCLRVLHARPIAISGSRDGTLRVWDVRRGGLLRVLRGHTGSVRCVDVNGARAVSGSYDTTGRIWDLDTGECLFVLRGHFHQIYAVAFDGVRVATGGLDTTVRVWDAETGTCTALLQGHSALVCQVQLAHNVLVTGGSDGRVVTFALGTLRAAHRVVAHDASVTALQRHGDVLVTGGNDGRVRVWEAGPGAGEVGGRFVRDMWEGECVWKVAVARGGGVCAVMGRRAGKTVMEVWSFGEGEEGV
ncbi:hypothetical protein BDZ94DRAFT_1214514 [Collybia nuda]|uniref:F-box domain-containing protein n=1 Tax=Collybia nuda TaxID=64659 RepID=A0A9P5YBG8_9AGAR|nr:hypothetical protein BDZ94DRAFT_1214514 [Collybia nuda]